MGSQMSKQDRFRAALAVESLAGATSELLARAADAIARTEFDTIRATEAVARTFVGLDITWPAFDRWVEEFGKSGQWPYMWRPDFAPTRTREAPGLPSRLGGLLDLPLAELRKIGAPYRVKGRSAVELVRRLGETLPSSEVAALLTHVQFKEAERGRARQSRARIALLVHTVSMRASTLERIDEGLTFRRDAPDAVMQVSCSDSCRVCTSRAGVVSYPAFTQARSLPPWHPGCRCSAAPWLPRWGS